MSNHQDTNQLIALYRNLFIVLVVITLLGIAVTFLHLSPVIAVILAIVIILIKSGIVYKAFKPFLNGKNSLIILFALTIIFFLSVIVLPFFNAHNHLTGTVDISKQYDMDNKPVEGDHHGN